LGEYYGSLLSRLVSLWCSLSRRWGHGQEKSAALRNQKAQLMVVGQKYRSQRAQPPVVYHSVGGHIVQPLVVHQNYRGQKAKPLVVRQ